MVALLQLQIPINERSFSTTMISINYNITLNTMQIYKHRVQLNCNIDDWAQNIS